MSSALRTMARKAGTWRRKKDGKVSHKVIRKSIHLLQRAQDKAQRLARARGLPGNGGPAAPRSAARGT